MATRRAKPGPEAARAHLDALLGRIATAARLLPALTVDGADAERARLIRDVAAGRAPTPQLRYTPRPLPPEATKSPGPAKTRSFPAWPWSPVVPPPP